MAKTKRCPSCGASLAFDARNCPHCPMSFADESLSRARGRRREVGPIVWVAVVLAVFYGAWQALNFIIDNGNREDSGAPLAAFVDWVKGNKNMDRPVIVHVPRSPQERVFAISHETSKPIHKWILHGTVYNLETLKTVAGCALGFDDAKLGAHLKTRTNGAGRYKIEVPPLPGRGYSVLIECRGYSRSYLNPGVQDVAAMSRAARRRLAATILRNEEPPYAVEAFNEKPLKTDFYVVLASR